MSPSVTTGTRDLMDKKMSRKMKKEKKGSMNNPVISNPYKAKVVRAPKGSVPMGMGDQGEMY